MTLTKETIYDTMTYVTSPNFTFGLEDKQHQFGILFEAVDMLEATGEDEFKQYPFVVSAYIVADQPSESFDESDSKDADRLSLIADANSYMGGVPVDHILTLSVKNGAEGEGEAFDLIEKQFKPSQAKIVIEHPQYGSYAAQYGKGAEIKYLQFRTEAAAKKYINYLIKHRVSSLSMMVGFILDRPINMMGESGWSVMQKWVEGA